MSKSTQKQDSQIEEFREAVERFVEAIRQKTFSYGNTLQFLCVGLSFVRDHLAKCDSSAKKPYAVASELCDQLEWIAENFGVEEEGFNELPNRVVGFFEEAVRSASKEQAKPVSLDTSVYDLGNQIARLKALGLGQAQIIYAIWGEKQGSGKSYQKALEQYKAFDTTGKAKFVVSPEIHPSDRAVPNDLWNSLAEDTVDRAA